jgi:hypothetical protein
MLETITQLLNRGVDFVEETYKIIDFTNLVKSVTEAKTRQRTWKICQSQKTYFAHGLTLYVIDHSCCCDLIARGCARADLCPNWQKQPR